MISLEKGFLKNSYVIHAGPTEELIGQWYLSTSAFATDKNNITTEIDLTSISKVIQVPANEYLVGIVYEPESITDIHFTICSNFFDIFSKLEVKVKCRDAGDAIWYEHPTINITKNDGFEPIIQSVIDGQNGISPFLPSLISSKSDDAMTAQEFKLIAVDRLGCENVRIKSKIINFVCDGIKTQKLCEMHDNGMTTAYVKRCNISIEEEGEPSILVYDNFQGAGTPVYESYKGDVQPCFQGMIADTMELKGKLKGQIVLYIAERLV